MYELFYEGEEPPKLPNLPKRNSSDENAWGSSGKDARFLSKLRRLLGKSDEQHRKLILLRLRRWPFARKCHIIRQVSSLAVLSVRTCLCDRKIWRPLESHPARLSLPKMLSGANAFEINDIQEAETEGALPDDHDATMLHCVDRTPNEVFGMHRRNYRARPRPRKTQRGGALCPGPKLPVGRTYQAFEQGKVKL